MANPEHVAIVKQGAEAVRAWREKNPGASFDLTRADLSEANLSRARLIGTELVAADLIRANLTGANFLEADLSWANLCGADLSEAGLSGTDLSGAHLSGANLAEAQCQATIFANVDLSETKGLEKVIHNWPSSVGVDTLFRSKGKIPKVFLRGCGVPEVLIKDLPSLMQEPLPFTCFISFTEGDNTFTERLYDDLQSAGVRCWQWKKNARWGRTLRSEIDKGVRICDKMIVICSKKSLNAPPVLEEIERALDKEDELKRQGREADVLFPIQIDNYLLEEWDHYLKPRMKRKNVGDFRNWNDSVSYKEAFDRLIQDLRPEHSPVEKAKE